mgnify:CR=1 FL=1
MRIPIPYPWIFGGKRMRWEQDLSGTGVSPRLGPGYDLANLVVASGIIVALLSSTPTGSSFGN